MFGFARYYRKGGWRFGIDDFVGIWDIDDTNET